MNPSVCPRCGGGHPAGNCPDAPTAESSSGGCFTLLVIAAAIILLVGLAVERAASWFRSDRGLPESHLAAIHQATGVWTGTFTCSGGARAVRLTIERDKGDKLTGTLLVWPGRRATGPAADEIDMDGEHERTGLALGPRGFFNHSTLALTTDRLTATRMAGHVDNGDRACRRFTLTKRAAPTKTTP